MFTGICALSISLHQPFKRPLLQITNGDGYVNQSDEPDRGDRMKLQHIFGLPAGNFKRGIDKDEIA
jgi:hypothetical protein